MRRLRTAARNEVTAATARYRNASNMAVAASEALMDSIRNASRSGISQADLARLTGYSEGRIWQIINGWQDPNRKGKE